MTEMSQAMNKVGYIALLGALLVTVLTLAPPLARLARLMRAK